MLPRQGTIGPELCGVEIINMMMILSQAYYQQSSGSLGKHSIPVTLASFREKQGEVENSGEGKAYHKTPPQKTVLDPPTCDTCSPPPFVHAMSFLWRERAQTRQIPLSEASKSDFGVE